MVESAHKCFISTEELDVLRQSDHPLCIIDCSVNMGPGEEPIFAYHKEHIPCARFLDLKLARDLASPYPFMMPGKDYFCAVAKSLDIRKTHTVIVYDCQSGAFASRGAFMLKAFGHPDVRILDGGLGKWKKEGRDVQACKTVPTADDFAYEFNGSGIKNYEDIVAISQSGSAQLIDCRPAPGFAGGNIPTSVNVPAPTLLNADNTCKSAEELQKVFEAAGVDLSKPMVFTCGAGVMATVGKHCAVIAGATGDNAVYDGSWGEYSVRSKQ